MTKSLEGIDELVVYHMSLFNEGADIAGLDIPAAFEHMAVMMIINSAIKGAVQHGVEEMNDDLFNDYMEHLHTKCVMLMSTGESEVVNASTFLADRKKNSS